MLIYLKQAWHTKCQLGNTTTAELIPILWGTGTGSEIMSRIAAPMVGGMITAPLLSLFVVPVVFGLLRRKEVREAKQAPVLNKPRRPT